VSLYWWLQGKLTRRARARRWAAGIRAAADEAGIRWEVGEPAPEFADPGAMRWDEVAGIAECADDGMAPDGIMVLRRGAVSADFLPLQAEGVRALLEAGRRRGLLRPVTELVTERQAQFSFSVHDDVPREEAHIVDEGLGESNKALARVQDVRGLSCFVRSPGGEVVGGAVGRTWGACCELQQLWVDPRYRRQGLGSRLVRQFEQRGAARGCHTFYLDTFSFQALGFYRSLGYRPKLEIGGFPDRIRKFIMVRSA
jgi:ribosomal protein S18 acetylase RimI-like enzyme